MRKPAFQTFVIALAAGAQSLLSPGAAAGSEPERAWTLGPRIGIGIGETRDEVLGPLAYAGPQPLLGLAFAHEDALNRHQAQLELAPAYKVDRFGYRGIFLPQRLDYRYLRTVSALTERGTTWRMGAGAALELDPVIYVDASTDFPYWQTVYDLRFVARMQHRFDESLSLEIDGALSVLGMGSRPPEVRMNVGEFQVTDFYTETHTDFRFLSFHDHWFVEMRPCLRVSGLGPGSQSICYGFSLRWLSEPAPIVTLENRLDLTLWF